jgi:hypothetical protein
MRCLPCFKFHYNPEEELESLDLIPKERMVTSPLLIKFLSSPHRRHLTYNDWQLIQSLGFVVWPTDDNELAYVNTETLADVLETITADPMERTMTPRPHADPVQTFDAKMSYTEHTPTYTGAISSNRNQLPHSTEAMPFSTDPLVDDDNMILIGANNFPTFLNLIWPVIRILGTLQSQVLTKFTQFQRRTTISLLMPMISQA